MPDDDTSDIPAEEFLAVVDHELGNLVTVIIGLSSALERRWDDLSDGERRHLSRRVAGQAAQLGVLLSNLRALRRGGLPAPNAAPVDDAPAETLAALVEDLRHAAPDHTLEARIDPEIPPMRLDAGRLGQVLRNLVTNAAKFSPAGSVIRLTGSVDDHSLRLAVEDTGPGIPAEHREEVFGKFVQLDPARAGTGLGLFISRALVEALGGSISIDDAPGGGCRVCVSLPRAP